MTDENKERILLVDDEPNLLSSLRRQLHSHYDISTAQSGQEAIRVMASEPLFPVVVSDMRMPGMDGVRFLSVVRQRFPDTVRIMLTGNADLDTAVNAVNEGAIFRFLQKPCPTDALIEVIEGALQLHRLQRVEKELLEKTVSGSVSVLIDVLSLTNPLAFNRAKRIKSFVEQIVDFFNLPDKWQFSMAAQLSQIGFVTVPTSTLEKIYGNEKLSQVEKEMIAHYPRLGYELLRKIPKLEPLAEMIIRHQRKFDPTYKEVSLMDRDMLDVGAEIIKACAHFDTFLVMSGSKGEAMHRMRKNLSLYNPIILEAMESIDVQDVSLKIISKEIVDLEEGDVIEENVISEGGVLMATKGQDATTALIMRLQNYAQQGQIPGSVKISNLRSTS